MAISATEKPLGKVFTSDYQLTIPSFQRAYTWQAENIEQLVNDLQDACADPDTPYFLGSLILVKDGPTQYQVIDGQQRLSSGSFHVLRVHIRTEFPVSAPYEHVPEKCLTTACP